MKIKSNYSNYLIYTGLTAIVPGLAAVSIPEFTISTLIVILGILISLSGITTLIYRLKNKKANNFIQTLHIIGSSVNIVFGIILIFLYDKFIEVFIIIFGITVISAGISQLIITLNNKHLDLSAKIFAIISALIVVAGFIMIFNPFDTAKAITIFLGIILIVYGILNIIMAFWLKSIIANVNKIIPQNTDIKDTEIIE
ncbi:MAG: DUF308 domain-containing protein [Bacteroidales bacterium]|jgi:uncharacterized membrane protein HdeD (DUF308 family)|nr:DUF308 domain-containing protein [Bacteroidales bacterium]HOL97054.1 DUF308 domain-containing protein [Bacteroidales bacterium]HOM35963.1 DUF308 domain-containing protein [Bacteroidales bacterium]HPD23423.1 DUF308 domain-containing protein [Bacteroidales bacterium]HRS99409.1 DUF308 domain-containing protein [Bacteroidales bacterium]